MTTPIGFGPFRPIGDRLPDQAAKPETAGAGASPAGMLAGRKIRRTDAAAVAGPAGPALAAVRHMASAGGPSAEPARPLEVRSVRLVPASDGGSLPGSLPGAVAAGNRVLTLMRSASAAADGALFRQAAVRSGIDPALMTPALREAVDGLVASVPLPPWSPAVASAVLADALDAALGAVMGQRGGSPGGIGAQVSAGAAARARDAVAAGDGDAAIWVADAVARRMLPEAGGGTPGTGAGIDALVEAVLAPDGEVAGPFREGGKSPLFPGERVREEVGRFMRHFGRPS